MATSIEASAHRAGAHVWAERQLFEVLGSWVASTPEAEVRVMLDRHSQHCAWRAAQWWERLPVLADVDRAALCAPPGPVAIEAAGHLRSLERTVPRLAAAYRGALPRLWVAYEAHRTGAGPVADAATLWTLGIAMPDLAADWHEGEAALQSVLGDAAATAAAAGAVAALDGILLGDGREEPA